MAHTHAHKNLVSRNKHWLGTIKTNICEPPDYYVYITAKDNGSRKTRSSPKCKKKSQVWWEQTARATKHDIAAHSLFSSYPEY